MNVVVRSNLPLLAAVLSIAVGSGCVPQGEKDPMASAQPDCQTVAYIENLNKPVIDKRIGHIKGINARVFVALDPILSSPDFDDVPYRHPDDMEMIDNQFQRLMNQDIDEIVIWRFRRSGYGAAVPFKQGCAVAGYTEPDHLQKLILMHDAYIAITRHGVDHPAVRDKLEKVIMAGRYADYTPHGDKVDIIVKKVRSLLR